MKTTILTFLFFLAYTASAMADPISLITAGISLFAGPLGANFSFLGASLLGGIGAALIKSSSKGSKISGRKD